VLRTAFATNFNFVNHGKNNLKAKLWNHTQNDTTLASAITVRMRYLATNWMASSWANQAALVLLRT
jgi:hypothetical protein